MEFESSGGTKVTVNTDAYDTLGRGRPRCSTSGVVPGALASVAGMVHTHDVTSVGDVVRKRYVSWDQGEPEREWAGLELLSREAPGLAPVPIGREHDDGRPVVVMSFVPGEPLGHPVTPAQERGLADALRRLFAVPVPPELEERANGPGGDAHQRDRSAGRGP